ncbi:PRC and DUF2382 domain-containing protein [Streptomyces sp. SL13]|jgi:uncharacterized protein (TIGR02271 family)|uniref:PRC and DUF2382 domain-containing protein n=1 Tax=Streptantibioticus silvisoli TaxID=2705255 RepID=A0AA90H563_9ACTN|nr:PRC and DUF2382 domain-containing protein [Streptantibioticus silvisoli]MDI5967085.1 PRC and DUF2382 domain-containing protein [Streptantibioticus silvisoli]MDI5973734.1 PRC and DUF2382 domain-containing protein [Streptantibioticus silvisoli]
MITEDQIPAVLDHAVTDPGGDRIGEAHHVFLDDATGRPDWIAVKTGMLGRHEIFVPIRDATLSGDHLEIPYTKETVKNAPNVDVDENGHLSQQEEHVLFDYYGIDWDRAWQEHQAAAGTEAGTGTAAGAATAAGGQSAASGRITDETAGNAGGRPTEASMTRSEERMRVGTERHETGRARLRKYVVTEEQQMTVPVRKEEVRIEREPITEANRDEAMLSGPAMADAEQEVTLYEDRTVVETTAEPVERVRMTVEEHVEEETVTGQVRKERIDAGPVEDTDVDKSAKNRDRRR